MADKVLEDAINPDQVKKSEEVKEPLKLSRGDYQVHIFLEETRGLTSGEEG